MEPKLGGVFTKSWICEQLISETPARSDEAALAVVRAD
jgi:hypothetical protein